MEIKCPKGRQVDGGEIMGAASRRKGGRIERELVRLHAETGVHAERVPLSGAAGGSFGGDIRVDGVGTREVKARKGEGLRDAQHRDQVFRNDGKTARPAAADMVIRPRRP